MIAWIQELEKTNKELGELIVMRDHEGDTMRGSLEVEREGRAERKS